MSQIITTDDARDPRTGDKVQLGSWLAHGERIGATGFHGRLILPTEHGHLIVRADVPDGWLLWTMQSASTSPEVSGWGNGQVLEVGGWWGDAPSQMVLSDDYVMLPPQWCLPRAPLTGCVVGSSFAPEVGFGLGDILGGLGSLVAGPAGGGVGNVLGQLFGGAGGGGASTQTRPANLPPPGSPENRARILQFLNLTSSTPREQVIAALRGGTQSQWHPADIADAQAMLNELTGGSATPTTTPTPTPAQATTDALLGQLVPMLTQVLSNTSAGQVPGAGQQSNIASVLASADAMSGALRTLLGPQANAIFGPSSANVLNLVSRTTGMMADRAAAMLGDPGAAAALAAARDDVTRDIASAYDATNALLNLRGRP